MASLPKEGPTISDCIISAAAGFTCSQYIGQINGFVKGKFPVISDRPQKLHHWILQVQNRQYRQHNSNIGCFAKSFSCHVLPSSCTLGIHLHGHGRVAHHVIGLHRIDHYSTAERC